MRNKQGQFVKGHRASPSTEFKKGQHWRDEKAYWNREWLHHEYITLEKSAAEIATEQGCTENNILYWLHKHAIPRRTVAEVRAGKHWGLSGPANGMYGVTGEDNPNWKGGLTPDRQLFYSSIEWKEVSQVVWKRDNGKCRRCGESAEHIHHIVTFMVRALRAESDNLILLCRPCHHWVHSRENISGDFIG